MLVVCFTLELIGTARNPESESIAAGCKYSNSVRNACSESNSRNVMESAGKQHLLLIASKATSKKM